MFFYGLGGFIAGLFLGALVNAYLLRGVPKSEWRTNSDLKLRYGAFNWGFAILGAMIAVYLAKTL